MMTQLDKIKLTKRSVDALVASDRRRIIWDRELKGFGVRLETSGAKTFVVRYRAGGGRRAPRRQMNIGRFGTVTVEEARCDARRVLGKVAQGNDPAKERTAARRALTVRELCELYLDQGVGHKKASTLSTDRGRIKRHIIPLLGNRQITNVGTADVEKFMRDVADGKTARTTKTKPRGKAVVQGGRGTAARTVGLLGAIFTFAVRRQLLSENPAHGVKRYPDSRNETYLSIEDIRKLGSVLSALENEGENPTGIACLRLLALTGARKGEIVKLRWDEVDFGTGCLRLRDSKSGAKIIPLGEVASNLIANQPKLASSIWVFPSLKTNGETPFMGIEKIWKKVRLNLEMPTVRIHDLRHTFASVGVAEGASLPIIGAILGHREVSTTQRYAHLADNPVRAATNLISWQIERALFGETAMELQTEEIQETYNSQISPQDILNLIQGLQGLLQTKPRSEQRTLEDTQRSAR